MSNWKDYSPTFANMSLQQLEHRYSEGYFTIGLRVFMMKFQYKVNGKTVEMRAGYQKMPLIRGWYYAFKVRQQRKRRLQNAR